MNISTRRFHVKSVGGGLVSVRDRDAPYHCHAVAASKIPDVARAAAMTERQYDDAIFDAIYRGAES